MRKFIVYFEIYGKKMKTSVYAISRVQAENIVKSKLVINKIEDTGIEKGSVADEIGIKKGIEDLFKDAGLI